MDALGEDKRVVRNLRAAAFEGFQLDGKAVQGQSVVQLDDKQPLAQGFFIFRMEPGAVTTPHEHTNGEHFYVIEGDLQDHDGRGTRPVISCISSPAASTTRPPATAAPWSLIWMTWTT